MNIQQMMKQAQRMQEQMQRQMADAYMSGSQRLDFLQADNELKTFAKETGGAAYFPRFQGEYPQIFQMLHQSLRNQYVLGYISKNLTRDGKYRRVTVKLNQPRCLPPLKALYRQGYYAPSQ